MNSRLLLRAAVAAIVLALLGLQIRQLLADPTIWPPDDFVEYWAAAHLNLEGKNPYNPELILPLQLAAGRDTTEAVMMWNPPWSLTFVLPLGLLTAREAQLLWLAINLAAIGFSVDHLWILLGGSAKNRFVAWIAGLAFLPTLFALQSGQISPLLLLGAVLFMECERRGWPLLAGMATILLAIKPHLAYLVWLAILCEALGNKRFLTLTGAISAGLATLAVPLALDHEIIARYLDALSNRPPSQWLSPTLGSVLRLAFGEDRFRLQFVPVAIGIGWYFWQRRSLPTQIHMQIPLLLAVSFVFAPYGAWPFDMVLLLPAIIQLLAISQATFEESEGTFAEMAESCEANPLPAAQSGGDLSPAGRGGDFPLSPPGREWFARLRANRVRGERPGNFAIDPRWGRGMIAFLIAIDLGCLAMNLGKSGSFAFIWVAPATLLVYFAGTRTLGSRSQPLQVVAA